MRERLGKILIAASLLALSDQLLKVVATRSFVEPVEVIKDFFLLNYKENFGIAFSINLPLWFILLSNFVLVFLIVYLALKEFKPHTITSLSLALILGGAFGNIIDRVSKGYVVDFISIWKYPAFNLADIYIVLAVLLIILFYGKIKIDTKTKQHG